jgi:hypothetical protein
MLNLSDKTYEHKILPRLAGITVSAIASALDVSMPYATEIRAGKRRPCPRHWLTLARTGWPGSQARLSPGFRDGNWLCVIDVYASYPSICADSIGFH